MYTLLKVAVLALPFVTATPLTIKVPRQVADIVNGTGLTSVLARDSITDIISNGADLVDQVNQALDDILPEVIDTQDLLDQTLDNIRQQNFEDEALFATFAGLFQAIVANAAPTDISDALEQINNIIVNSDSTGATLENIAQLLLNGLAVTDLTQNVLAGYALSDINSYNNDNPAAPDTIYPQKQPGDAPYAVPESQLRSALYIPAGFTYGQKRPILFVPGTGAFGGVNFISNLGKLLGNDGRFDPVYLNIPGAQYNDTQINSEYIAYGMNYIGSVTGNQNDLAVIGWSQGNLDTQWALQYWPSTRPVVTDFISASADFHGTTLAYFLDPALVDPPLPPSVIQQEYDSNFVLTLRAGGGGSPYVNSTSVWSITDEIVQPQYSPYASAAYFTEDLPGTPSTQSTCSANASVPYTNNQIQTVCQDYPASGIYTHEGVLYHPLTYALALDALTNDGPGDISRIDLDTVCNQLVAPGLSLEDVLATEGLIPLAAINLLLYPQKVTNELAVQQYALQANAACATTGVNTSSTTNTSSSTNSTVQTSTTSLAGGSTITIAISGSNTTTTSREMSTTPITGTTATSSATTETTSSTTTASAISSMSTRFATDITLNEMITASSTTTSPFSTGTAAPSTTLPTTTSSMSTGITTLYVTTETTTSSMTTGGTTSLMTVDIGTESRTGASESSTSDTSGTSSTSTTAEYNGETILITSSSTSTGTSRSSVKMSTVAWAEWSSSNSSSAAPSSSITSSSDEFDTVTITVTKTVFVPCSDSTPIPTGMGTSDTTDNETGDCDYSDTSSR